VEERHIKMELMEQVILHQLHHHKEIMEEPLQVALMQVVVEVVEQQLQVVQEQVRRANKEMVVLVQRPL
jgi:hypothetical protein